MTRDTYTVSIRFANGSFSRSPHGSYHGALDYCRNCISYSGGRVSRVEIEDIYGSPRAMWDASWTDESKAAGLRS